MNIDIIFEDTDILLIDKPPGITVNNSETTTNQITVQNWVEDYLRLPKYKKITKIPAEKNDFDNVGKYDSSTAYIDRAGIVHRLDKETSGLLIIAKNLVSFENLQHQFKDRLVKKVYLSLAHGKIKPPDGEINVPVGRLPWNRKQFGIYPGGKESKTLYKTIKYFVTAPSDFLTLVELYPQSGRTHQIRVHLKYIGHPVFADFLYGGRKTSKKDRKLLPRVFLHAAKISFVHPKTKKTVTFESKMPSDLSDLIDKLNPLS